MTLICPTSPRDHPGLKNKSKVIFIGLSPPDGLSKLAFKAKCVANYSILQVKNSIINKNASMNKYHFFLIVPIWATHYSDVIMGTMVSQITSLTNVYSTVYSGTDQRKHQSSVSLAFVCGIHLWSVNSPHKWPVTRKMFDDVIMLFKAHSITHQTKSKHKCPFSVSLCLVLQIGRIQ